MDASEVAGALVPVCFLAAHSSVPCDGPMDKAHLIAKQRLKREVSDDPRLIWHPSLWVWACRRHHGDFDARMLRLGREDVPVVTELAARVLGMEWSLDRDFGPSAAPRAMADRTSTAFSRKGRR